MSSTGDVDWVTGLYFLAFGAFSVGVTLMFLSASGAITWGLSDPATPPKVVTKPAATNGKELPPKQEQEVQKAPTKLPPAALGQPVIILTDREREAEERRKKAVEQLNVAKQEIATLKGELSSLRNQYNQASSALERMKKMAEGSGQKKKKIQPAPPVKSFGTPGANARQWTKVTIGQDFETVKRLLGSRYTVASEKKDKYGDVIRTVHWKTTSGRRGWYSVVFDAGLASEKDFVPQR